MGLGEQKNFSEKKNSLFLKKNIKSFFRARRAPLYGVSVVTRN